jgi:ATP-dependent RNA helicase RhlE
VGRNARPCRPGRAWRHPAEDILSASPSLVSTGFDRFELHELIEQGVRALGFENPRPIQVETIPAGLKGRDVLGLAQTGTGKTAAFALPLMNRLMTDRGRGPRALILAPTRELATQIAAEMRQLARFTHLKVVTIYGGVNQRGQVRSLRQRPEIVVGCPGRVLDLFEQKELRLNNVETLVLDEADHMFDMGFLPDIRRILKALPRKRQNLLFSATMPKAIRGLADDVLEDPHVVELADAAPAGTIDHALYLVAEKSKRDLLERVLTSRECDSAIVFIRTKHRVRRLAEQLQKAGFKAIGLQGNLSQARRDKAMAGFRSRRYDILVATDIAARGIDVTGVSHVINFDVPSTPEAYTHRIGRTGRAEREGVARTFVTSEDRAWVRATERMISAPIRRDVLEGFAHEPEATPRSKSGPPAKGGKSPGRRSRGPRRARAGGKPTGGRSSGGPRKAAGRPRSHGRRR